jgi:PAS domain S-box-containing protein/putative nucleotidyltransferase with HDIG domain
MAQPQLSPQRGTGELQASTAQLRNIIGALPDAAFVVDQEGLVCFVNPAAMDLFNLPAADLLDKPFAFSITPDVVKQIQITRPRIKTVMAEMRAAETTWAGRKAHLVLLRDITERIATEQALDESEERAQVLLQSFPDSIYMLNRDGVYVGYHAHDPNLLFAPPSRFLGRKQSDVLPPEHMRIVQPLFDKALATGKPQTLEYLLEINGEPRFFEERLVSYDRDNVLSLTRDITARKKIEEASRRYSATLWAISLAAGEFMQDGYSAVTIQNMLERLGRASEVSRVYIFQNRYVNGTPKSYRLQYEWIAEGIAPRLGNPALEEFPMIAMLSESLAKGKVVFGQVQDFPEELRQQLLPQEVKSILSVPIFEGEKWWGFIGFNECVQERKWSEIEIGALRTAAGIISSAIQHMQIDRALRESEERYRGIVEDQMDFIVRWRPDMTISFVNEAFCRFFGGTSQDWIGKSVQENIHIEDIPQTFAYGQKLVSELMTGIHEHRNVNRHGEARWCQWRDRVIVDQNGQMIEVQSVGRDIHETKLRAREQEGIAVIAAALRGSPTRLETLRVITDKLLELVDAQGVAVAFHHSATGELTFELGNGDLSDLVGQTLPQQDIWKESAIHPGKTYLNNAELDQETVRELTREGAFFTGLLVPLVVEAQPIGAVLVVNRRKITEDEERLLKAVADIAASSVHRATLYEETQRRLNRVTALRTLNLAVSGNMDLRISLEVLLDQITEHLGVDAADVLVLEPQTQALLYTIGRGFWTKTIEDTYLNLSGGLAGQAVLEQHIVQMEDLQKSSRIGSVWREMVTNEKFTSYLAVPLIAKGQVKGVLEIFSRQEGKHDAEWLGFIEALAADAAMAIDHAELFGELQRSNDELIVAYDATIWGWSKALELRDQDTQGHSERVVELTIRLARLLGVRESELPVVRRGAILHDIGKMGVPDSILLKPGPLMPEERDVMRRHPEFAHQMLSAIPFLQEALDIPYCHHERWDGKGYPRGMKGEEIPLAARIFSVVDVWDALVSDRPYRSAWSRERAFEYIKIQSGKAFDPQVVEAFLDLIEKEKDQW